MCRVGHYYYFLTLNEHITIHGPCLVKTGVLHLMVDYLQLYCQAHTIELSIDVDNTTDLKSWQLMIHCHLTPPDAIPLPSYNVFGALHMSCEEAQCCFI